MMPRSYSVLAICALSFFLEGSAAWKSKREEKKKSKGAVVTLVSGTNSGGYASGALALGQSIRDVGSKLDLVVMVTQDVPAQSKRDLAKIWQVVEVETVVCNHKHNLDETQYDLKGDKYVQGIARWRTTCTKFQAWNQIQYERVIFMDSDMLAVAPIDDALWGFSNASFAAAPETFPPDTFNAGFMVLTPSTTTFQHLLELNERIGSTEGGDQGVLNNGLCPDWFTTGPENEKCGRLPWLFNVEVVQYNEYKTLRLMNHLRVPSVIHFVSDGKPWTVLLYEYQLDMQQYIDIGTKKMLGKQAIAHMQWRDAFFRASGGVPSNNAFLIHCHELSQRQGGEQQEDSRSSGQTAKRGKRRRSNKRDEKEDKGVGMEAQEQENMKKRRKRKRKGKKRSKLFKKLHDARQREKKEKNAEL